ncbi:hypothetical protein GF373_15285 [bacterium]|nr:hypothetical protein [bacterium]
MKKNNPKKNIKTILSYHEQTKHHFHRLARSLGFLDWANQPHPFRIYDGAPIIQLEFTQPHENIPYEQLYMGTVTPRPIHEYSIANFFRYAMGLSAWKQYGDDRWALRVNPSSGNLHPTESYAVMGPRDEWNTTAAIYHYNPEEHAFQIRCQFSNHLFDTLAEGLPAPGFFVGLSSIFWREAWKYGERAFRYCQHDTGHALAALRLSAALLGWKLTLLPHWTDEQMTSLLGLTRTQEFNPQEREEAELIAYVTPSTQKIDRNHQPDDSIFPLIHSSDWYGSARATSDEYHPWPIINEAADATQATPPGKLPKYKPAPARPFTSQGLSIPAQKILLQRRSAMDFNPQRSTTLENFQQILLRAMPSSQPPWDALFWPPQIHLLLFVHRVEGLNPGLYLLLRNEGDEKDLRTAIRKQFLWKKPQNIDKRLPLYLLQEADCRGIAHEVSCGQTIASHSFFSMGMLAKFAPAIEQYGPWFYKNLFWEAGTVGQVLYLEAENIGARGTGIGCYFDDAVHEIVGIKDKSYQSLYHFTIGTPIEDPRLSTLPPYENDPDFV